MTDDSRIYKVASEHVIVARSRVCVYSWFAVLCFCYPAGVTNGRIGVGGAQSGGFRYVTGSDREHGDVALGDGSRARI